MVGRVILSAAGRFNISESGNGGHASVGIAHQQHIFQRRFSILIIILNYSEQFRGCSTALGNNVSFHLITFCLFPFDEFVKGRDEAAGVGVCFRCYY